MACPVNADAATPAREPRWQTWTTGALLLLVVFWAYRNALAGPFLFDDVPTITENPTITRLWPLSEVLMPPEGGMTVSGRPLTNLSLALNYALNGTAPRGYHGFNLAIHALATLTFFGLVRRTLSLLRQEQAMLFAGLIAGLWAAHPLLTESVTYIVQRAESLAGLWYLLTLYTFVRSITRETRHRRGWAVASVAACLAGMATKEIMVSAPLVVLIFDRTFVAGSFAAAWRERRAYYAGLAATWLMLAWLMLETGTRAGTAGLGLGVSAWWYALTSAQAIVTYLKLTFWPQPLVFDYGMTVVARLGDVWWQATLVVLLLGATVYGLWRRTAAGFLGACFFLILAPTSSIVPITSQTMAEHRMYLPLAAVVVLVALGARRLLPRRAAFVLGVALPLFVFATAHRNEDYRSDLAIWSDTVAKIPTNPRAHYNLGAALAKAGRADEERAHYVEALRLQPVYPEAYYNLGNLALRLGRTDEAIGHYAQALRQRPEYAKAHYNLGTMLLRTGRLTEAATCFVDALRYNPADAAAHSNLGTIYYQLNRLDEAAASFEAALQLQPANAKLHYNLGMVLLETSHAEAAAKHFRTALSLQPDYPAAQTALNRILSKDTNQTRAN